MKSAKEIPDAKIRKLDLSPVMEQLWRGRESHGWTQAQIRQVSLLYRMFLYLCLKYPDRQITPTFEIDLFWHQHILNTQAYARDCDRIFGYFLHHEPTDEKVVQAPFVETLKLVRKEFYA